jgi:hypothetical protein
MRILRTLLLVLVSIGFTAVCTPVFAGSFVESVQTVWETVKEWLPHVAKEAPHVAIEIEKARKNGGDKGARTGDVTLTAPFPMPPAGATGTAQVADTGKAGVGQAIFIPQPFGWFEVLSKSTASGPGTLTLRSLNNECTKLGCPRFPNTYDKPGKMDAMPVSPADTR